MSLLARRTQRCRPAARANGRGRRAGWSRRGKPRLRGAARRPRPRRRRSRAASPRRPAARAKPVLAGARPRSAALVGPRLSRRRRISPTRISPSVLAPAVRGGDASCCSPCLPATRASSSACWSASRTNAASSCAAWSMPGLPPLDRCTCAAHAASRPAAAPGDAPRCSRRRAPTARCAATRYELLPGAGLLAFRQAMAATIATAFVRETRFDPLHQAATEQTPARPVAGLVAGACRRRRDGSRDRVRRDHVPHPALARAARRRRRDAHDEILRLVQSARPPGAALHLCFSPRIAAIPGLVARLASLRDCVMVEFAPGAAATGRAAVPRPPSCGRPTRSRWCTACRCRRRGSLTTRRLQSAAVPAEAVPTHVLFSGRAWPITAKPLTLGWSVGAGAARVDIAGGDRRRLALALHARTPRWPGPSSPTTAPTARSSMTSASAATSRCKVGDVLRLGAPGVVARTDPRAAGPWRVVEKSSTSSACPSWTRSAARSARSCCCT